MLKKILISLLIALSIMTFSEFDCQRFLRDLSMSFHGQTYPQNTDRNTLTEGSRNVYMGMSYDDVLSRFGDPIDIVESEYGFSWNIFHENFQNYIQIGIQDDSVVGIYTNSPRFVFRGISVGCPISDCYMILESSIDYIIKGRTKYMMDGLTDEKNGVAMFETDNMYVTVFYDTFKNNSVTAIHIIEYETEQNFNRLYAQGSPRLAESFEKQNFYVTNALRVREGLPALTYRNDVAEVAYKHSLEMAENNYFDHTDRSGGTVSDRTQKAHIRFRSVGENIAMGAQNSLFMHELLMNSEGHRKNILNTYRSVGMGVAFSADNTPYLTQNFLN